jgi:hypothetical protein
MKFLLLCFLILLTACESSEEKAIKSFVSSQFKDPQSTQFQKITLDRGVMCGELNTKNSYGAYTGFQRFVARNESNRLSVNVDGIGAFDENSYFANKESEIQSAVENIYLDISIGNLSKKLNLSEEKNTKSESGEQLRLKYPREIQSLENSISSIKSEDKLKNLVSELSRSIAFKEAFKDFCPLY